MFIAAEIGRPLQRRPEGQARVSVVTLAELRLGVLRSEGRVRERREATLAAARRFMPLPIDEHLADELAALLAKLRASHRRAKAFDCFARGDRAGARPHRRYAGCGLQELHAAEPRLSIVLV